MAERKPRNFAAMREDRVVAMARDHFGREFASKSAAMKALGKLPVDVQHGLKKPRSPSISGAQAGKPATRRTKSTFANELRGGVAPPSSTRLAEAPAAVVKRYARMTTGLDTKSKAQALTLMARFAPTDVAKAAGGAIGRGGLRKPNGPSKADLVDAYNKRFGTNVQAARTKMTKAALQAALDKAPAPRSSTLKFPAAQPITPAPRSGRLGLAIGLAAGVGMALAGKASAETRESTVAEKKPAPAPSKPTMSDFGMGSIGVLVGAGLMKMPAPGPKAAVFSKVLGGALVATGGLVMGNTIAKADGAKPAAAPAPSKPVETPLAFAGVGSHAAGVKDMSAPLNQAFMNSGAKAKAEAEPTAKPRRTSARTDEGAGSGPIQVAGFTRADGVQVQGYTRQRKA